MKNVFYVQTGFVSTLRVLLVQLGFHQTYKNCQKSKTLKKVSFPINTVLDYEKLSVLVQDMNSIYMK